MERQEPLLRDERELCLVDIITGLPRKILQNHHVDGLSNMVLHELGHEGGFGFEKATYLIDNPDFDRLIGVAGFDKEECHLHAPDMWEDAELFSQSMKAAEFHNKIRSLLNNSFKRRDINLEDAKDVEELGHELGFSDPSYFTWQTKYDNHGLFMYEKNENICLWRHGILKNISALLSWCHRG